MYWRGTLSTRHWHTACAQGGLPLTECGRESHGPVLDLLSSPVPVPADLPLPVAESDSDSPGIAGGCSPAGPARARAGVPVLDLLPVKSGTRTTGKASVLRSPLACCIATGMRLMLSVL